MSRLVKILGIQIEPDTTSKQANIEKVERLLERYKPFKPDLVILSEVFNMGIVPPSVALELAEEVPGPTYEKMSSWAKELNCYLVGGSIIERCKDGLCRNNSIFFAPDGSKIANYYKLHMFQYYGSREREFCSPGDESVLVKTPIGNYGMTVCFDLRFTELYRQLAFSGAEVLLVPAAWPYPRLDHWVTLNKARAIENLSFVVAVNHFGEVPPKRMNVGNSMIIDPWGSIVAGCGEKETGMLAEIDLDQVKKLREEFPILKDRRLDAYANLKVYDITK